jgi:hypothetical protein
MTERAASPAVAAIAGAVAVSARRGRQRGLVAGDGTARRMSSSAIAARGDVAGVAAGRRGPRARSRRIGIVISATPGDLKVELLPLPF